MAKQMENITLSNKQQECVFFKPKGTLLVQGVAGSGKTTVVLERARHLDERGSHNGDGPKLLVLTYNRALTSWIRELSMKSSGKPIESSTFHSWASEILTDRGFIRNGTIAADSREGIVRYAKNIVKKYDPKAVWPTMPDSGNNERQLVRFLAEEISWIKNWGFISINNYIGATRTGRGNRVRLTRSHRETIFKVYQKYEELLENKYKRIDFDDAALFLERIAPGIPMRCKPSHLLVDEAQDLGPAQFRAIASMAVNSLTIAADRGQQIYRRGFTWKSVGINVHSGNSKFLLNSFRSTGEIVRLATSLLKNDSSLVNDPEYHLPDIPPDSGILPELYISGSKEKEISRVLSLIRRLRVSFPDDNIGVVAYSWNRLEEFAQVLERERIPWVMVKETESRILTPGVKLVSFHSAKGLEFDHVIVTGLKDGYIPHRNIEAGDDEEAFLSAERKKFYVAMTRAKLTLTLSAIEPVSQFVNELKLGLYKIIR